MIFSNIFLL